jgi:hypothetical protein
MLIHGAFYCQWGETLAAYMPWLLTERVAHELWQECPAMPWNMRNCRMYSSRALLSAAMS